MFLYFFIDGICKDIIERNIETCENIESVDKFSFADILKFLDTEYHIYSCFYLPIYLPYALFPILTSFYGIWIIFLQLTLESMLFITINKS